MIDEHACIISLAEFTECCLICHRQILRWWLLQRQQQWRQRRQPRLCHPIVYRNNLYTRTHTLTYSYAHAHAHTSFYFHKQPIGNKQTNKYRKQTKQKINKNKYMKINILILFSVCFYGCVIRFPLIVELSHRQLLCSALSFYFVFSSLAPHARKYWDRKTKLTTNSPNQMKWKKKK